MANVPSQSGVYSGMAMNRGYSSLAQSSSNPLAAAANMNRDLGASQQIHSSYLSPENEIMGMNKYEVSSAVSHVSGVVPTGLFTTYIPEEQILPHAEPITGGDRQPVTVYYTDDLYPPYYAQAKKVKTTKKAGNRCCE